MWHLLTYKVISQVFLLSAGIFLGLVYRHSSAFQWQGGYLAQGLDALETTVCLQCGPMASLASQALALFYLTGISPDKCCCSCYPVFTSAFQRTHAFQPGSGGPLSGFAGQRRPLSTKRLTIPPCVVCLYGSPLST